MQIPAYVIEVINTLRKDGKQAFMVGGCVRDLSIGKEPADYDVTTSATTDEIKSLFQKTVPIGEKHGTVAVLLGGGTVEVSTYKGQNHRHDENAILLMDDLLLRDFTINAMALDESGNIIDPFGGLDDLKNKLIRAPRDLACDRFSEDPLRMMRAIRFCSIYGFSLHPTVRTAIAEHSDLILTISPERIREELNRILRSRQPASGIRLLFTTGLLVHILPEVIPMVGFNQRNSRHDKDVFEHTLAVLEAVPSNLNVRLAALLHDIGKPMTFTVDENGVGHFYMHHLEGKSIAETILRRLKYDNQTIHDVTILVSEHMSRFPKIRNASLKRLINRVGDHNLEDLLNLQRADILGSAPPFDFSQLDAMQAGIHQIRYDNPPMNVKDLAIGGNDLMEIGFAPGPIIGQVLEALLNIVLDDPETNDRETLLSLALNITDFEVGR